MEETEEEFDKLISKICNCVIRFNSKEKRACCCFDIASYVDLVTVTLFQDKDAEKEIFETSFYYRGRLSNLGSAKASYEELKKEMREVKRYYS